METNCIDQPNKNNDVFSMEDLHNVLVNGGYISNVKTDYDPGIIQKEDLSIKFFPDSVKFYPGYISIYSPHMILSLPKKKRIICA
jgi:hypothetical protein